MTAQDRRGFDGTSGTEKHSGYRTRVIQLLRDSKVPVCVDEVADRIGTTVGIARYHLESLADAGMADRVRQERTTRGRPKVLYAGTLPNQTHERAQGYRLLAEALTSALVAQVPDAEAVLSAAGRAWGARMVYPAVAAGPQAEADRQAELIAKLAALWFAPEVVGDGTLVLHHCPFPEAFRSRLSAVASLHRGLIDGALAELGSARRVTDIAPLDGHGWTVRLGTPDAG